MLQAFSPRRVIRALTGERLLTAATLLAVVSLLAPPILLTLFSALRTPGDRLPYEPGVGWGIANFTSLYTTGALHHTAVDTAVFVGGSVALAFVVGFALAWAVERTDLPGRGLVFVLLLVPLLMPGIVTTIGWVLLLGERTGALNVALRTVLPFWDVGPFDIFTMYGMVVVQGFGLVTLVFVFLRAGLRSIDPSLEETSRISGATQWETFRGVTLPVLRPHVLAVLVLSAILAVESFEVPLLLALGAGADILSTRIYFALNDAAGGAPRYGTVAALGVHFMVLTYALFAVYRRATRHTERFATISGRMREHPTYALGRWRWPAFSLAAAFLFVVSIAPLLVLAWTSLLPQYLQPGARAFAALSLDQYAALLADSRLRSAIVNTLVVATAAPTLAVLVALAAAWLVVRGRGAGPVRTVLDVLTSSSVAIPSVVAANAFLLFYLRLNRALPDWVPLFGTVVVLVFAYAYRLAVAYHIQRAGVVQMAADLEDAAATTGVGRLAAFRGIVAPLVRPSTLGAWLLLSVVAVRELTLPLVINADGPPFVVSTLIWKLWGSDTGQAAALGMASVAFMLTVLLAVRWVAGRGRQS